MPIRTPRDAYQKLKERYPDSILAFARGQMLEFIATDAHDMQRMVQLEVVRPNGYDIAMVHNTQYFPLKARLKNMGRDMRLVFRKRTPTGKTSFQVQNDL